MNIRHAHFVVMAATAACAFALPAYATTGTVARSERVELAGTSLATAAGVEHAYRQLQRASRNVCASSITRDAYSQACADQALDDAVARVGSPALSERHRTARAR